MSKIKKAYWLAEGDSLQAVRDYQEANKVYRKELQVRIGAVLEKYGATHYYRYGGLDFADNTTVDRDVWRRAPGGEWYARLRTFAGKKVTGGAERQKELRGVTKGCPNWDTFAKRVKSRGTDHIVATDDRGHGVMYTGTPGFLCIGDSVVLTFTRFGDEQIAAPADCTKQLLRWEVEKMRFDAGEDEGD